MTLFNVGLALVGEVCITHVLLLGPTLGAPTATVRICRKHRQGCRSAQKWLYEDILAPFNSCRLFDWVWNSFEACSGVGSTLLSQQNRTTVTGRIQHLAARFSVPLLQEQSKPSTKYLILEIFGRSTFRMSG